ncbi:NAD-dependent protein deacetylase hst2-1 [Fulvia fulva]|uniref:NAD-dependent protein deacetylase n=1 Tax=Passalora fulva TaxID=5499 RepID=A0A9Q8PG47_PASFU|nr:NAD-dependent protein deacetylase hst2-1 [Fulvia fulva]KAK4614192.1 NAD-dependent protein deacetylase hst2-1 [Fulvia fulva]KAK4614628.1 NAD-dependent protein deacetylase hst2-1 [Fulvia fulva]UJO21787.1 NAD-dependent protein deacetylase hst2-1 [Fulvia fulva]WPV20021.1 NAD-dependent protein deacetylase hst2-1 [Fulvia fulva]WPV35125.1 NAD-dependent protein deacetylase hst2-1 [Fulvia fulva]
MGNEESSPIDEAIPPQTLTGRTIEAVAEYIRSGKADKIVVMTGAGISTSAGIPDFRSPETGLYANLARLDLPYAEAVFDISYFREKPEPFYTLAHELYPGKYRPTITHSFIRLLQDKGLLLKLFTQNIDCLEREAGVHDDKIIEAHGSFARQSCIECKQPYPEDEIREHISNKTIPRCHNCDGLVKPEIVFFGEQLPAAFFENRDKPAEANLAIVIGSSLTVQPFASLPQMARDGTPRLLLNREWVGGIGGRSDDVCILGDCDDGVRKLAKELGWLEELEALWAKTAPKAAQDTKTANKKSRDEAFQEEMDKLTKEVDETLNLSKYHQDKVRNERLPGEARKDDVGTAKSKSTREHDLSHVFVGGPRVDSFTPAAGSSEKPDNSKL